MPEISGQLSAHCRPPSRCLPAQLSAVSSARLFCLKAFPGLRDLCGRVWSQSAKE